MKSRVSNMSNSSGLWPMGHLHRLSDVQTVGTIASDDVGDAQRPVLKAWDSQFHPATKGDDRWPFRLILSSTLDISKDLFIGFKSSLWELRARTLRTKCLDSSKS
jgi:hypothetical protein